MNRVPVIVWNPAYIEELEPRDPINFISGDSQIVTAPASDDGATIEEVVDEPDVGEMDPVVKDVDDFLGRLTERIQSFKEKLVDPDQPPVILDEAPAAADGDVVGDSVEGAEVDPKQALQQAVQSLSKLNDGLRSVLSLSRDQRAEVPDSDAYDTGKATEEEFRLFPTQPGKG